MGKSELIFISLPTLKNFFPFSLFLAWLQTTKPRFGRPRIKADSFFFFSSLVFFGNPVVVVGGWVEKGRWITISLPPFLPWVTKFLVFCFFSGILWALFLLCFFVFSFSRKWNLLWIYTLGKGAYGSLTSALKGFIMLNFNLKKNRTRLKTRKL